MENQADKSQDATPYKLEEAKKKGQVGKSHEFVSACSLCVMSFGICISIPKLVNILSIQTTSWIKNTNEIVKSPILVIAQLKSFAGDAFEIIGSIMALGVLAAVLSSLLHIGSVFSLYPLKFDLEKLNPVNGIKKIISIRGLVELFKLVLKVIFFAIATFFVWRQFKVQILHPGTLSPYAILNSWKTALVAMTVSILIVFILFAIFDLWYSKREFAKKMRMSTRDIKDEYRKREGDPELKNKRKKNLVELLRNLGGASKIRNADVIITNPTHVAVALQYRSKTMALPIVLTKGRGFFAKFIIKRAKMHGIPVYRRPSLARKLYAEVAVNNVIPTSEQQIIADIYKEIIKSPNSKVFL
ncbi:flagellar biosynthetic protein FlhB [Cellvibrio zantedeschiae]|uniref:Flagellar biosynthetic protein FlhB n=1 Tax=Cellvibrio zantedeschiae TaxID=1237077 RepID=A0ABQ3B9D2_9GAMM|nr:EscU/YscU/HrcU family type III secretion system export apparatus switch protein [Cellvibrio zantedeschiae]GGY84996.1 flagellar biosynthetic protein FlhB [Cellvibrio zantedeschiae]